MTDLSTAGGLWAERLAGSSAGAAVSLIYLLPETRREAAGRFFSGIACGLVFGGPAGLWLQRVLQLGESLTAPELMLSGSAAASLSTWWALGVLSRLANRFARNGPAERKSGPSGTGTDKAADEEGEVNHGA